MNRSILGLVMVLFMPLALDAAVTGEMRLWHKITIDVTGPTRAEDGSPNPFRDVRLDVVFTAPGGAVRTVPGYFAADGNAGESGATSGSVWRAHLTPDSEGIWTYRIVLKQGGKVAINGGGEPASPHDGLTGTFTVVSSNKTGSDFRAPAHGRLDYVGEHALRWRGGGGRFFKTAMGHPEAFLEFKDFDNTDSNRTYAAHVRQWTAGDPTWRGGNGKGIVGVVNYLATQGVNGHYFLLMNSRGDGKKAFPWTSSEAVWSYDVSKLDQWGVLFDHMMQRGVMPQFVLEECENQMLFEVLDGTPAGDMADCRKQFYREMVARFGHLNAVTWNIGEENGWDQRTAHGAATSDAQRKSRASALRSLLSSTAHIVVHNGPSSTDSIFTPLLGDAGYSGISFQGDLGNPRHGNGRIGFWHARSEAAGRPWVVTYDEPFIGGIPTRDAWRQNALWASLVGGSGGVDIFGNEDITLQDYTSYAVHYSDMRRAKDFLTSNAVPFWEMSPNNALLSRGWCLAKTSDTYVVYLPSGGTANITLPAGTYSVHWFDPRNDAALIRGRTLTSTGTALGIGDPPNTINADWVALIRISG